jgi:hypothetical protein
VAASARTIAGVAMARAGASLIFARDRAYHLRVMLDRSLILITAFVVGMAGGCDKAKPEDKAVKADDKAAAKVDVKAVKAEVKQAEPPPKEAKHFDVNADKSGVLARTAAALETTDATKGDTALREHLAELSHHAEAISSDETLCQHMIELRKAAGQPEGDLESCIVHFEHEIVILGPEVFSQVAQCIMAAQDTGDIEICEAAEKEAELLVHEHKSGDNLSPEVCEQLFAQFEKLALEDAPDHAEFIRGVLEDVKPDVMTACGEQGTQAEYDCAMKAKNMEELGHCQSIF